MCEQTQETEPAQINQISQVSAGPNGQAGWRVDEQSIWIELNFGLRPFLLTWSTTLLARSSAQPLYVRVVCPGPPQRQ